MATRFASLPSKRAIIDRRALADALELVYRLKRLAAEQG